MQLLGRVQKHRAMIGVTSYTGISQMTPQQIQLFENLNLAKPPVRSSGPCSVIFALVRLAISITCRFW